MPAAVTVARVTASDLKSRPRPIPTVLRRVDIRPLVNQENITI
jgi:hypothetical protein